MCTGFIKGSRIEYEENHVPLKINLGEEKFRAILKPYQILAMRYLWANPDGKSSRYVYEAVNEAMEGGSTSRASIINSLNALVDDGVLGYHEITGKGGHRRIYKPNYNEVGFREYIAETVFRKLLKDFPEETRAVLATA